jgi:Raf kinase inhibitor-like YbhB/YbcL family protein
MNPVHGSPVGRSSIGTSQKIMDTGQAVLRQRTTSHRLGWPRRRTGLARITLSAAAAFLAVTYAGSLAGAQRAAQGQFRLESGAFQAGGFIPKKYTCSGDNVSPALSWKGTPGGTKSLVLIVADPDAPGGTWIHWLLYNLPANSGRLPEGLPKTGEIQGGARQGTSSFQEVGYGGPCPPPGDAHHYHFKLYALNARLTLRAGATRDEVERAMKGHIMAEAELVGLFKR